MMECILFERQGLLIKKVIELEKMIKEMKSEIERLKGDNNENWNTLYRG